MYIQVTEKCPQNCPHCCMSATQQGSSMDWYTFTKALHLTSDYDDYLTIGGGEPTIWKHFAAMIDYISEMDFSNLEILIVTSGIRKRNTMKAVRLMEEYEDRGEDHRFRVVLSDPYDGFHNPDLINQDVYEYFSRRERNKHYNYSHEFIRKVTRIIPAGRGARLSKERYSINDYSSCPCETMFIKPNGEVRVCGCPDSPIIGNVFDGIDMDNFDFGECYKTQRKEEESEEDNVSNKIDKILAEA